MTRSAGARRPATALAIAAAVLVSSTGGPVHAQDGETAATITVDLSRELGPINHDLVGLGWHEGGAPLTSIADLEPHLVRVDASLQEVSHGPDEPLELDPLLERVRSIRSVGGEPLVILSYLPAWLGEDQAFGRDPTRVRPSDLDAWERLVHDVVRTLATAPDPALLYEAWNEPDIPLFWQDTPAAFLDTVERSARAVAAVEAEIGVDLRFGGPAVAVPDPAYLVPFLQRFRTAELPLDFVSWHYYGNYPFFGPDGAEFPITEPVQPVLGRPNPLASPAAYGPQVGFVQALVDATFAGAAGPRPELVVDEWNLSAAGFDRRHDTAAGAAFAAGVLVEMQDAGLDAAAFFRANDTRGVAGEHGLVRPDGTRKPAWWSFRLFQELAPTRVAVRPARAPQDDLWALASTDGRRTTLLLSRFRGDDAPGPPVRLRVAAQGTDVTTASLRRIDDGDDVARVRETLEVVGGAVELSLPRPGVALVELTSTGAPVAGGGAAAGGASGVPSSSPTELPATGGRPASPAIVLLLLAFVVCRPLLAVTDRLPTRRAAAQPATALAGGPLPARSSSSRSQ